MPVLLDKMKCTREEDTETIIDTMLRATSLILRAFFVSTFALVCALPTIPQSAMTVEVLSANTRHWTTYWNDSGSPGTANTNCQTSSDGSNTNCTTTTIGARPASSTPIYHTQVDMMVKMPDGNQVTMQCHSPPIWAICVEPQPGVYQAKIDKHHIEILFQTQGRPDYNKDGTIKKQGKIKDEWVKYSFE
jgi:hypothetical protein